MAYEHEFDLSADITNVLHKKIARAIDKAAIDVINGEKVDAKAQRNYEWALRARRTPETLLDIAHRFILNVLDNPTIAADGNDAKDSDVQFVVNSLVDVMSDY